MIVRGAVALRPFDRRHLERTRAWANDEALGRLVDRAWPVTDAEHERWYEALQRRRDCAYFAVETVAEGRHVGNVWLWDVDARHRKAEVRVVLGDADGVGRGLGTAALLAVADFALDRLNLRRLYAYVLGTNPRARRAFEKAGFAVEGVLREDRWVGDRYADVWLMGRLLRPT
jgi:diamine N-acetyltransferase